MSETTKPAADYALRIQAIAAPPSSTIGSIPKRSIDISRIVSAPVTSAILAGPTPLQQNRLAAPIAI